MIVVDDGSTDDTPAVAGKLAVRYLRVPERRGQSHARNRGIELASAPRLSFLDDDDVLLPDALERLGAALDARDDVAFVYGLIHVGDAECRPTGELLPREPRPEGDVFVRLLAGNLFLLHAPLLRKKDVVAAGGFESRFDGVEDWHLWMRLAERRPVHGLGEPIAIVRQWTPASGQVQSNRARQSWVSALAQDAGLSLPRARALPADERASIRRQFRARLSEALLHSGGVALADRRWTSARDQLLAAVRIQPSVGYRAAKTIGRGLLQAWRVAS